MVTGDEDVVIEALDVLQECVEMEQPLINDHIEVSQFDYFFSHVTTNLCIEYHNYILR